MLLSSWPVIARIHPVHLMNVQGGPKKQTVLRVDNFVTVSGKKVCYVKSFQIVSWKMYKTWVLMELNILCVFCINIQRIWNYAEFLTVAKLPTLKKNSPVFCPPCRMSAGWPPNPKTKPINLGCDSAKNWQLPSTSTIAIVISTQSVSW